MAKPAWRLRELSLFTNNGTAMVRAGFRHQASGAEFQIAVELMGVLMLFFDELERELLSRAAHEIPGWVGVR